MKLTAERELEYPLARANAHHHTPSSSRGILGNPSETPKERLHPAVWSIALCGGDDVEVNAARKELSSLCGKRTCGSQQADSIAR